MSFDLKHMDAVPRASEHDAGGVVVGLGRLNGGIDRDDCFVVLTQRSLISADVADPQ